MSGTKILSYDIVEQSDVIEFKKTGKYKINRYLGGGSFGEVYLAQKMEENNPENSKKFALKIFKKYKTEKYPNSENDRPNEILSLEIKELSTLNIVKRINNPYLMKYVDWKIHDKTKEIMVLMEHLDFELSTFFYQNLGRNELINETFFKNIAFQMLSGLNALHKNGIIHCDIKPQNILYKPKENIIQIIDYGLCQRISFDINKDYKATGGTYPYMAPDLLLGNTLFFKSLDIWSLGCVLVELCTGKVIFPGNHYKEVLEKIVDIFGPIKELLPGFEFLAQKRKVTLSQREGKGLINYIKENQKFNFLNDDFYDLVNRMLCINPTKRISAEKAMKHSWFANSILL